MQFDIREHIKNNFKDSKEQDIRDSIEEAIHEKEEITLPGLGVFFEILWKNVDDKEKTNIINIIKKDITKL